MRFMTFVKSAENQGTPPQALYDAMGPYIQDSFKRGVLVDTGGLSPMADSTSVRLSGGKISVVDGPYSEAKEVVGGYAVLELPSKEAAIEEAKRFLALHIEHWPGWEGTSEIRQIFEPND